jgi:hypothetical protein
VKAEALPVAGGAPSPLPPGRVATVVVGRCPVAIVPIGVAVAAVNACAPDGAPLNSKMNALMLRYSASDRLGFPGGIVADMYSSRSFDVRLLHVVMKFAPASGGASF